MSEPQPLIDPIAYAWALCNPKIPFPEKLRWETRGQNLKR